MRRMFRRLVAFGLLMVFVISCVALFGARMMLVASLPDEKGTIKVAGLASEVVVERDARGVPTIRGETLTDVSRALGFVHAQERFFQMDMMRRYAAGRLSEAVGERGLEIDRRMRVFRFESRIEELFKALPEHHRTLLSAYADGVNAGLANLGARPPEYLLLDVKPEAWRPGDTLLVECFMFSTLSMGAPPELTRDALRARLPRDLADFLTPDISRWDEPMLRDEVTPKPAPIPGARLVQMPAHPAPALAEERSTLGSNCWAVAGSRTSDGRAILADDMHLMISAPPPWFRAQLQWGDRRAIGVTLPGVPGIVVGSTNDIAWGFTNTCGDFEDHVVIETLANDPGRYRTPEGDEPFTTIVEEIKIKDADTERLELRITRWGAVGDKDAKGRPLVLKWSALEPGGVDVGILDMLLAKDLDEAVKVAQTWRGPSQNILIADRLGRIGWTISGWIPKRTGFDGTAPVSWATKGIGWQGAIDEKDRPVIIDPKEGILFTANNRTLPVAQARMIGANWSNGYRARRIAERLREQPKLTERDLLDIQLDTRAEPFDFYRGLILEAVPADHEDPAVAQARKNVEAWNGRADADQSGYRLLKLYVRRLEQAVIGNLCKPVVEANAGFTYFWWLRDEPLRRILEERPPHMLPSEESWNAFLRAQFQLVVNEVQTAPNSAGGIDTPWGAVNRANIRHQMASGLGPLSRWLGMPRDPLDGDSQTVRVVGPAYGASERLVVSPGHWDDALFEMPSGQSGHPMSRHFDDGHDDWVKGLPTPLLPGATVKTLRLTPAS